MLDRENGIYEHSMGAFSLKLRLPLEISKEGRAIADPDSDSSALYLIHQRMWISAIEQGIVMIKLRAKQCLYI